MVRLFWAWWVAQLTSLLPPALRAVGPDAAGLSSIVLISPVDAQPAELDVTVRLRGRPTPSEHMVLTQTGIARLREVAAQTPRAPWHLRVPAGVLLERQVVLPLAAERAPEQVLQYEMEKLTPFAPADLFWSCQVTRRDRVQGRLHLRLTMVPRAILTPATGRPAGGERDPKRGRGAPRAWPG